MAFNLTSKLDLSWLSMNALRENAPGIILALLFMLVYLYFGTTLNNFGVGQVDNLFDADVGSWMRRISSPDVKEFEMRGPHPFTSFIFQPFRALPEPFHTRPNPLGNPVQCHGGWWLVS